MSVPIVIPISEVNNLVNESISGVVYEDNSYTDNGNDQFKAKVVKDGAINIEGLTANRIFISVPLKIWVEQGFGALGHYVYKSTTFGVKMNFISDVALRSDWHVITKTKATDFQWIEKPVLSVGVISVPIAPLIAGRLKKKQTEFTKVIDDKVLQNLSLAPYVLMAVNQFRNPMEISPEYNTWLRVTPVNFSATPLRIFSNQISGTLGVGLYSETFVGLKPMPSPPMTKLPDFVSQKNISNIFQLQTTVNVSYEEATALAKQKFVGQEMSFRDGKLNATITDIKLYRDKDKITIEATMSGGIDGQAFITGEPVFNATKDEIVLTKTKFRLKGAGFLASTYVLLFQGKITKMIEDDYGIPLKDLITASRKSLTQSLNSEIYKGIALKGVVLGFEPSYLVPNAGGITVIVDTRAQVQLMISGLNF